MTIEYIRTFLTVVELGTFVKASEQLFCSQSSISNRLKMLEAEVGCALIVRAPGQRGIDLTPAGEAFLPVAQQWLALWSDTQRLKFRMEEENLSIGSIDLVNNHIFLPFFKLINRNYPNIKLSLYTHHSSEIHGLLTNRKIDIGFVFSQVRYADIISQPVYKEKMYLLCHKNSPYYNDYPNSQLNPCNEIFLRWGSDYQLWHDRFWDPALPNLIVVNTGAMIPHYFYNEEIWSIVPLSLIQFIMKQPDLWDNNFTYYSLKEPPPPRICYQLTHRYPKESCKGTIATFNMLLDEYINCRDDEEFVSLR